MKDEVVIVREVRDNLSTNDVDFHLSKCLLEENYLMSPTHH